MARDHRTCDGAVRGVVDRSPLPRNEWGRGENSPETKRGGYSTASDDMKEPKSTQNLMVPIVFDRIPATGTKQLNPKGAIVQ